MDVKYSFDQISACRIVLKYRIFIVSDNKIL
jgi:hypothetical protein